MSEVPLYRGVGRGEARVLPTLHSSQNLPAQRPSVLRPEYNQAEGTSLVRVVSLFAGRACTTEVSSVCLPVAVRLFLSFIQLSGWCRDLFSTQTYIPVLR